MVNGISLDKRKVKLGVTLAKSCNILSLTGVQYWYVTQNCSCNIRACGSFFSQFTDLVFLILQIWSAIFSPLNLLFSFAFEFTFSLLKSVINFTTLLKQKKQDINNAVASTKAPDDELTCSVCLEQVNVGELIRSLPCLHQVIFFLLWFLVLNHSQLKFSLLVPQNLTAFPYRAW